MAEKTIANMQNNPFAALFTSVNEAVEYSKSATQNVGRIDHGNDVSLPEQVLFSSVNEGEAIEYSKSATQNVEHIDHIDDVGLPEQVCDNEMTSQDVMEVDNQVLTEDEASCSSLDQQRDSLIERIFLITDNQNLQNGERKNDLPSACTLLENDESGRLYETIEQLLFNRLLLQNPEKYLIKRLTPSDETTEKEAKEDRPLIYLIQSFNRVLHEEKHVSPQLLPTIALCRQLIVRNVSTALISPELFAEADIEKGAIHQQLYDMLASNDCTDAESPPRLCLYGVAHYIATSEPQLMETAFVPLLNILANDLKLDDLLDAGLSVHLSILVTLAGHPNLASLTLDFKAKMVHVSALQQSHTKTFLEILLGKSCLVPDAQTKAYLFFEDIRRMGPNQVENEEFHLQNKTDSFHFQLLTVVRLFLRHDTTRSKVLRWMGDYIARHEYLAKMWTHERLDVFMDVFGPDAALLNLSAVLVRVCLPFCSEKSTVQHTEDGKTNSANPPKFLKIDSTYIFATAQLNAHHKGVHGVNMHKETFLQSTVDDSTPPVAIAESYHFISECFFLTHRAIYLGVHGLIKKFYRLNRSLNSDEQVYRQILASGHDSDEMASRVVERFETGLRIYQSIKGILTSPTFLRACMRLYGTTAQYLNQIAMTDSMDRLAPVILPFPEDQMTPKSLYSVPEYVVENMTDMLLYIWRFAHTSVYLLDPFIHDLLLVITIYMGNKSRMSNPHLRASLAEVLQVVMPLSQDGIMVNEKEEIFHQFPHSAFLTVATLQLFVDIEFTDDPNQFEQKFHYRQPLYKILKYLWQKKSCNAMIKQHVKSAISNIDDASHPLFLQFTNLLLNDSIYLLDEAMGFLSQIKGLEREKSSGEWEELDPTEKMQKEGELKQLGMLAKYHNVLSNDTVDTLVYLTEAEEVKNLFSHPALGDRVAAMLDDFLLKLVGPKMGALRVRDLSAYQFKPKILVVDLCKIYINLCEKEDFCRSISRDGRSYSSKLFPMACQVLRRIGTEEIRIKMMEVSERIKLISNQEEEEEEMFMDAPDEFFDALMSTLMRDPVILPASKQVVDRSTISRHLMSDPTDPFNRSPLTMQDIIPNYDLKSRITQWIEKKRSNKLGET